MKKFSFLMVILFVGLSISINAQQKLEVTNGTAKFSVGNKNAFIVNVYEGDLKFVKKGFKSLMKDYKGKVKMKSEIFAEEALIRGVSEKVVNVYALVTENKGAVRVACTVDLGDVFLNKQDHSKQSSAFEKILLDFALNVSKDAVKADIKKQEKVHSKLEKEKRKLISKKKSMEKEIIDFKQKIEDNESAIVENITAQEVKTKEIAKQKVVISKLKEKLKAIK